MRLGKLTIHNYTSYNDTVLDLREYTKALLVGIRNQDNGDSNGAGKTNFISAPGWCIWGESQAEQIDEVVKTGESECLVSQEFEHDGKDCVVTRTRNKDKSQTTLNFYIDGILSNGDTVTNTQKKIIEFLRLDYTTYVNSVCLRQDDIFSFATTGKNKEGRDILEKVLDLEEYDLYQDETKANIKRIAREIEVIEVYLSANENINNKILATQELIKNKNDELTVAESKSEIKQALLTELKIELANLLLEKEKLQKSQSIINEIAIRLESQKENINSLIREFNSGSESKKTKVAEFEIKINSLPKLKVGHEENLKNISIKEQEKIKSISDKKEKQLIIIKDNKINNDKVKSFNQIILEEESLSANLSSKKINISSEVNTIVRQISELETENSTNTKKINSKKLESVEYCQECLTQITEDTIDHFKTHLQEKIKENDKKILALNNSLEQKRSEEQEIKTQLNNSSSQLISLRKDKDAIVQLIVSEKQIKENDKNIETDEKNLNEWLVSSKNSIKEIFEKELAGIDKAKIDLEKLNTSTDLDDLKKEITIKKTAYSIQKENYDLKKQNEPEKEFDETKIKSTEGQITTIEKELNDAKQKVHILVAEIKSEENNIVSFDIIIKEIENKNKILLEKKRDLGIYNRLHEAFSSKGIRADIVQNAINELERHSNELLQKLTFGRLSLEFLTKKEVKLSKGESVEKTVFKVIVKDGESELPFHMYSGGEKFRIALVLRVALAQLLQRRANSKLEFLIIDEAFSPLDSNGVEKIIEVINELQKEFKTILVITHRNDVKQYFDEIITVIRDGSGSRIL